MDRKISERIFSLSQSHEFVGRFAAWFSSITSTLFFSLYIAGIIFLVFFKPSAPDMKFIMFIIFPLITLSTSQAFRHAVQRLRPYEEYPGIKPFIKIKSGSYGLPSNHAASSMIIALAAVYIHPVLSIVLVILAVLAGLSRVFACVHYLFDILAAWFMACLFGMIMLYVLL
jgi:undecaprenyl-diphosphatase